MNVPNYICYNYSIQNVFIFPLEEIRKFRDNNINQMNMNNQMMMMPNAGMMIPNIVSDSNYNTNKVTIYDCFDLNQKNELLHIYWINADKIQSQYMAIKYFLYLIYL